MRNTTLILTLATAAILSLGCEALTAKTAAQKSVTRSGKTDRNGVAPQPVTIVFGDGPVSLAVDTFQMPIDLAVLAH